MPVLLLGVVGEVAWSRGAFPSPPFTIGARQRSCHVTDTIWVTQLAWVPAICILVTGYIGRLYFGLSPSGNRPGFLIGTRPEKQLKQE
ncbi:hypothetical protein SLA2020_178890 [Shorea laevis]